MKQILIVDDEKTVVNALREGFKRYEKKLFHTDIAYNAEDAIKMISSNTYALVISDIRLPKKSGIDVLIQLKKHQPEAGFIAMTAFSNPEVEQQVEKLGGLKFLEKPFSFDVLEDLVLEYIKGESGKEGGLVESLELTSILQLIHMEGKSLVLMLELNDKTGYFGFDKGEIVDAKYGELTGIEAAKYMIATNKGDVRIDNNKSARAKTISIPFMSLLLDSMKEKDEMLRRIAKKGDDKFMKEVTNGSKVNESPDVVLTLMDRDGQKKKKISKEESVDTKKLNSIFEEIQEQLGKALKSVDVFSAADGLSIAGVNSEPKACAFFNRLTDQLQKTLKGAEFPLLDSYYLLDVKGALVIIVLSGEYRMGLLLDRDKTQLGMLFSVVLPHIIEELPQALV